MPSQRTSYDEAPELVRVRRRRRVRRRFHRLRGLGSRWREGFPRILALLGLGVGGVALVVLAGLALATPSLLRMARDGRSSLVAGRDAMVRNDPAAAQAAFARATSIFGAAEGRLRSPLLAPLFAVPYARTNLAVARSLASIGRRSGEAGEAAATGLGRLRGRLRITRGTIDLGAVRAASSAVAGGVDAALEVADEAARMPSGWVLPPLEREREEAQRVLPGAATAIARAHAALEALPSLMGAQGLRRYVIAFSNLSELRGSGGLIGYVTLLGAARGHLALGKVSGRPTDLFPPPGRTGLRFPAWFPDDYRVQAGIFQNINLTADFPTAADLVVQAVRPTLGPVDGVIGVDPVGIGAVLELTGPVRVASWPAPLMPSNVARVMMHDVYLRIPDRDARDAFFGQVVHATFSALVSRTISLSPRLVGRFDEAVEAAHFRMYATNAADQGALNIAGLGGSVDRAAGAGDVLSLVSINATGNKGDWYLGRSLRYTVTLDPARRQAIGRVEADFANSAPPSGLPDYVIGARVGGLATGTNRQNVVLLRSARDRLLVFALDGRPHGVLGAPESELRAYRVGLDVPARSVARIEETSVVEGAFFRGPRGLTYRLVVLPQAVAHPDTFEVDVVVPPGWRAQGPLHVRRTLASDLVIDVILKKTARARIVDVLLAAPRALLRLLRRFS